MTWTEKIYSLANHSSQQYYIIVSPPPIQEFYHFYRPVYVNDVKSAVTDCDLRLCADDTCLIFSNENVSSIENSLNVDLIVFVNGL